MDYHASQWYARHSGVTIGKGERRADFPVRPPLIPWSIPHPVYPCSISHLRILRLHTQLVEYLPQGLVGLFSLFFNNIQVCHDLGQWTVGLGFAGVDVAAGGDVVVVFLQLRMIDDTAEFFLFLPIDEGLGNAGDAFGRDEVLWVALLEYTAGVDEQRPTLPGLGLGLVEEEHDARSGGVVEEVFGQVEDALDEIVVHKPLADGFFLVGSHVAGATGSGAGVENDGGAALVVQAGVHVLGPAPVGGGLTGETGRKAVEFVGVVVGLGEPVLIPHGIGHDSVESAEFAVLVAKLGVLEGVADLDLSLHVVDDHVHVGHGPGLGDVFLAEELERSVSRPSGCFHFGLHGELALYEETAGAAGGIVNLHTRFRFRYAGHNLTDLAGGVELAGTLASALGEFADEVFVALADDVGLDVLKAQALGADGFDEVGETVVVEVALAVGGGVEIDSVDDALEQRVFPGDGPHVGGDGFTDSVRQLADDGPDGLLRIVWHEGEVKPDELVVGLDESEGLLA